MKTSIKLAAGAALLMLGASAAGAQQATNYDYYVTGEGENRMVMSRSGGEGMPILQGENGQRPGQCPNGTFYSRGDNSVASCDDDSAFMTPDTTGGPETTGSTAAPGTTSVDQPLEPYAPDTGGSSN